MAPIQVVKVAEVLVPFKMTYLVGFVSFIKLFYPNSLQSIEYSEPLSAAKSQIPLN